ncbi:MAG TPA: hypothetical protein VFJ16_10675 [Longimicrobium sp.]|nr:hypothetical protein [Longimicrobium sp.]
MNDDQKQAAIQYAIDQHEEMTTRRRALVREVLAELSTLMEREPWPGVTSISDPHALHVAIATFSDAELRQLVHMTNSEFLPSNETLERTQQHEEWCRAFLTVVQHVNGHIRTAQEAQLPSF